MAEQAWSDKFSPSEINGLRLELRRFTFDSWEFAEIVTDFLTGRGYGTCTEEVRDVMMRVEGGMRNVEGMLEELAKVAYVM
jgi:hypothetical protein